MKKIKNIIFIVFCLIIISCGPRTGIHEEVVVEVEKIDTGVVKSIYLTMGDFQYFVITILLKDSTEITVDTRTLENNIDDSVIVYGLHQYDRKIKRLK